MMRDLIPRLRSGDEGREAVHAFLEKRTPGWLAAPRPEART